MYEKEEDVKFNVSTLLYLVYMLCFLLNERSNKECLKVFLRVSHVNYLTILHMPAITSVVVI